MAWGAVSVASRNLGAGPSFMPLQALLMTPQHHVGGLGWLHPAGPSAGIGGVSGQMGVWSVFLRINYKDD